MPNSNRLWKLLKIAEFRTPTHQDVRKKGSKTLKLHKVRNNCFTLAMTKTLVVIINSLKVPKIKKILLHEMKFLVLNYSCLQNPWIGGYAPTSPFPLSSTEFVEPPPPRTKFLGKPLIQRTVHRDIFLLYISTTVFITGGNYVGYMFRLLNSHLQAYSLQVKSQDAVHTLGSQCVYISEILKPDHLQMIPVCLHQWNT